MALPLPPAAAPRPLRLLPWLLAVLLVAGCVAIYRHVGEFGFLTFDDEYNLVFNPHLGPLTPGRVAWAFSDMGYMRRYIPLAWVGFSTVFSMAGLNPAGYHLANLCFHLANALLFFGLLRRLLEASQDGIERPASNWRTVAAFLGAMFWAWHPLRVESVAWCMGMMYQQAELLLLLAFFVFVRSPASYRARTGALIFYSLSLLAYPLAIGFAPVFGLVAFGRLGNWRKAAWIALPFFVPAVAVAGVSVLARASAGAAFIPMPTLADFPLEARVMQACYVWVYFAWIPLWPATLRLFNPVLVSFDPWSAPFIFSAAALLAAVVACVAWPRARRTAGFFLAAHLCVLVPMMGLVEHPYFPSDRYSAFSQAVMAAALALGLARLRAGRVRFAVVSVGLVAGGILATLSTRQTEMWRDAATFLDRATAGLAPEVLPTMRFERPAVLKYRSGDAAGALAILDQGIALLPDNASLRAARADLARQASELRAELAALGAPASTPRVALMHQELGLTAARAGDLFAAREHLRLARLSAPDFYQPAYNLALVELQRGKTRAALGSYLWAEAHAGGHLPPEARARVLGLIADQFAAAGETQLAGAAKARSLLSVPARD